MSLTKVTYSMIQGAVTNALDIGAVADGSTDNQSAVQAWIDSAANGSILHFPKGTYRFASGLTVDRVIHFTGDGRDSGTVLLFDDGAYNAIEIDQADGVSFRNLRIEGDELTTPTLTLIMLDGTGDNVGVFTLDTCGMRRAVTGVTYTGLLPYTVRITSCELGGMDKAIDIINSLHLTINNCTFGTGLSLTTDPLIKAIGQGVRVTDNQFETYVSKANLQVSGGYIVEGNHFEPGSGRIVVSGGYGSVIGNTFRSLEYDAGFDGHAIEVQAGDQCSVIGNSIRVDSADPVTCIYHYNSYGGLISGNNIYRATAGTGIYARRASVVGNNFYDTATTIKTDADSLDVEIADNRIAGTGAPSILSTVSFTDQRGTFTPVVKGSTSDGVGTYVTQFGTYQRKGKYVMFRLFVDWSAHTGTGDLLVDGLPFTSDATRTACISVMPYRLTFSGQVGALVNTASTQIAVLEFASGGSAPSGVAIDTDAGLSIAGVYEVE